MKSLFPFVLVLGLGLIALAGAPPASARPPNNVFILADDLGWADLACYGSDLHETPNLDRLAREGVRFTRAYAMSVCTPTRAALLTGLHAARLRMTIWREATLTGQLGRPLATPNLVTDLPPSTTTLAETLKAAGYLTFHVGKWHLGDAAHYPEAHGFDVNIGGTHWGSPNTFFWPFSGDKTFRDGFRYVPGLGPGQPGDYLTDRFTDEAIKLIAAAGERPFFLNLWFHNPHKPIQGKPGLVERYRRKIRPGLRHRNPDYAAMVHSLDENVGRVLHQIEESGLAGRTLVVFTSDNGGVVGEFAGQRVTDNFPLRSGKGSLYEGGIRVPLIVRLPAAWQAGPPGAARPGAECAVPVTCMDVFPTIAHFAGVDAGTALDGRSFAPLLTRPGSPPLHEHLFFHYPHYYETTTPVSAVSDGEWKLLEYFEDGRLELHHLPDDPAEKTNLAGQFPDRARALRQILHAWWRTVGAQLPQPSAPPATAARTGSPRACLHRVGAPLVAARGEGRASRRGGTPPHTDRARGVERRVPTSTAPTGNPRRTRTDDTEVVPPSITARVPSEGPAPSGPLMPAPVAHAGFRAARKPNREN